MGNALTHLSLILTGMRLVGGFPFVEKKRSTPLQDVDLTHPHTRKHKKEQSAFLTLLTTEDETTFHKSTFWAFWTILMGVAATLCFAIGFWNLKSPILGFPQDLSSAFYAYKINEVMDNVTLAGLMLHVSYRRSRLREMVEFSYHLLRGLSNDTPVPSIPLSKILPFTINLAATLTITILLIYGGMYSIMTTTIEILQQIAFFLMGTNILCLFQWVVCLSIHEYDCIIMSLNSCLEDTASHMGLRQYHYEYPEMSSPAASVSRNHVMCYRHVWAGTASVTHTTDNRDPVSPFEVDHRLRDAKERLVEVNKLLQLVRRYCGVPVTLMMLYSVVACILSLFYMSFLLQLDALNIAVTCLFTVNALVAPMFLCNVPYSLDEKRQELKFALRTHQFNPDNKRIRAKLGHLLGLLQVTPEPTMLDLFTLGRGSIASILGFISTYVVILLQFRFTETHAQPNDTTTTTDVSPATSSSTPLLTALTGPPI